MSGKDTPLVQPADGDAIAKAAARLGQGALVALPTETVYGLAARADSAEAVAQIYRAKGRPDFNPLIVHVASLEDAGRLAEMDAQALRLAERFWPGPLTMVLPLRRGAPVAGAVTAGLPTIAIRMPAHPVMRAVLQAVGLPLAAPSANRSGAISPTRAEHVLHSLGEKAGLILDAGPCEAGLESTIVAIRANGSWQILRPGPIPSEALAQALGSAPLDATKPDIEAPGQLASHYAPGKPVRLGASEAREGEFLIGFHDIMGDCNLSEDGDLSQAAARLYDCLHQAASSPSARIAVAPIPDAGMGAAINDRLRRAAA